MISVLKGDLAKLDFDMIVCPVRRANRPAQKVSREIFREGGKELQDQIRKLPPVESGECAAVTTQSMPCSQVILTGAPETDGDAEEKDLLASCFWNSIGLAYDFLQNSEKERVTIAFPCIECESLSDEESCQTALKTIQKLFRLYPEAEPVDVAFVTRDQNQYRILKEGLAR
ncbi:MAG: macro domain-containing protein [Erysipelotrichaceae bacterium]|nr:macro domain-containing protein [Erysipelotrichaceae bacterium]